MSLLAGYKDWALSSLGATLGMAQTGDAYYSNEDNINDGSPFSYAYVYGDAGTVTFTITLPGAVVLSGVTLRAAGPDGTESVDVDYYDGSWHTVLNNQTTTPSASTFSHNYAASAYKTNVTKIRAVVTLVNDPDWMSLYVLSGWGHIYSDEGVRIRLSDGTTLKVGMETLEFGSPVRMRLSDDTTYMVGVCTTDNVVAAPVRLRYSSGLTVALADYDAATS